MPPPETPARCRLPGPPDAHPPGSHGSETGTMTRGAPRKPGAAARPATPGPLTTPAALLAAALFMAAGQAAAETRVALLIGNADYRDAALALPNPGNDVRALDAALTRLGFTVRAELDQTRAGMLDAFAWLRGAAEGADIALVFFAGHAVQVGQENFLIGVEMETPTAPALSAASVTLGDVLAAVDGLDTGLSLVVLDACRDNPFADDLGRAGLAPVSGGVGTLVAYATDPGNVAADGLGDNSPFTAALLEHIETPGIDVRIMFGRVRQDVVRLSRGMQVPWVEEAVLGEHYLAAPPAPLDPDDELHIWREAVEGGGVEDYRGYLARFPAGLYAIVAELRIDALEGNAREAEGIGDAELPGVEAALQVLGYMVPGPADASRAEVRRSLAHWQAAQPTGARDLAALMEAAAAKAVFIGTYTAGILRNDLQRFATVEESLRSARESLRVAETRFAEDPDAGPALERMRAQVAEIERIRAGVAADLDASRTYYGDLIVLTERHLSDWISEELRPRFSASRSLSRMSDRMLGDAGTFLTHLAIAEEAPDGSFSWFASLMEEL